MNEGKTKNVFFFKFFLYILLKLLSLMHDHAKIFDNDDHFYIILIFMSFNVYIPYHKVYN